MPKQWDFSERLAFFCWQIELATLTLLHTSFESIAFLNASFLYGKATWGEQTFCRGKDMHQKLSLLHQCMQHKKDYDICF